VLGPWKDFVKMLESDTSMVTLEERNFEAIEHELSMHINTSNRLQSR